MIKFIIKLLFLFLNLGSLYLFILFHSKLYSPSNPSEY
jgi:hypothetical protein